MNYHPFELKIEDLEALSTEFEILSEEASLTIGGYVPHSFATTLALGEEGGDPVFPTLALREEGGDPVFTTLALGEEGGDLPSVEIITQACYETGC